MKNKKLAKLIAFFSVFFAVGLICLFLIPKKTSHDEKEQVTKILQTLSKEERVALEDFFRVLIIEDQFSYALFGDKPMSFGVVSKLPTLPRKSSIYNIYGIFSALNPHELRMKKGYGVWQKYKNQFCSENYLIKECKDDDFRCDTFIIIINKKCFLKKVQEHLDDFKRLLGPGITPQHLLNACGTRQNVFDGVLRNHDVLLGILLGYGRNNAWLFHRREEIKKLIWQRTERSKDLEEELEHIQQSIEGFAGCDVLDCNPLFLNIPGFCADPNDPETKLLKKKYTRQYKEIVQRYKKGDFLQITLEQLLKDNSSDK